MKFFRFSTHRSEEADNLKKEEKLLKNHPLLTTRTLSLSADVLDSIPLAKHSPPIDQLKIIYEELGLGKDDNDETSTSASPPSNEKQREEKTGVNQPHHKQRYHQTSMATVPLKASADDKPLPSSKGPNNKSQTLKGDFPTSMTPASSSNALTTLEAHNILSTNGYFTFKASSPAQETACDSLSNLNEKFEKQEHIVPPSNTAETNPYPETTVTTTDRSTSSILARVGDSLSPSQLQDLIQRAIVHHEQDRLKAAFQLYCITAQQGLPIGLFLTGLALRHGWGCKEDQVLALSCLEYAAEIAAKNLKLLRSPFSNRNATTKSFSDKTVETTLEQPQQRETKENRTLTACKLLNEDDLPLAERVQAEIAKHELAMSIYELGQCYRFGWGAKKSMPTAVFYLKIAADLGDCDAQMDLANCYNNGIGMKSDRFMAASYFRLAGIQGKTEFGLSWVYKQKYDKFFKEHFPKYAKIESETRSKDNVGGSVLVTEAGQAKDRSPLSYLKAIQKHLQKSSSTAPSPQ